MDAKPERAVITPLHPFIDPAWLDRHQEEIIEPDLPIIDCHHHFVDPSHDGQGHKTWDAYQLPELLADLDSGHNIRATVFIEATSHYRRDGPEHLRPVGETEYATAIAEAHVRANDGRAVAAGIIGRADFLLGAAVEEVLQAHIEAGHGRFKGVRANLIWVEGMNFGANEFPPGMMRDPRFREGLSCLAPLGLVCDANPFHPSLPAFAELAAAFPDTVFIVNHCGIPLGIGAYGERQPEVFRDWRDGVEALSRLPNVYMKLGGFGGPYYSPFVLRNFRARPMPPSSAEIAEALRPYTSLCIDAFGTERCMFESNFPVDKYDYSYAVAWNALKRLAGGFSESEKRALFFSTAKKVYTLEV